MVTRGPLIVFAAVVFLAGGLFALRFPVFIEAYDQFGWQVKCGSGFTTDLTQASNAEKKPLAKRQAPVRRTRRATTTCASAITR